MRKPAENVTEVGVAFWYGFAFGDLTIYIPLLFAGLTGHLRGANWGRVSLAAALGITVYGPIVSLVAVVNSRDASGWEIANETPYWIACFLTAAWGVLARCILMRKPRMVSGDDS